MEEITDKMGNINEGWDNSVDKNLKIDKTWRKSYLTCFRFVCKVKEYALKCAVAIELHMQKHFVVCTK